MTCTKCTGLVLREARDQWYCVNCGKRFWSQRWNAAVRTGIEYLASTSSLMNVREEGQQFRKGYGVLWKSYRSPVSI